MRSKKEIFCESVISLWHNLSDKWKKETRNDICLLIVDRILFDMLHFKNLN